MKLFIGKLIGLLISGMLCMGMIGCNEKTELDKACDYISTKYGYSDEMIEKVEDTKFIAIKIPTEETTSNENMIKYAEEKQDEIQADMWEQGYDVAITVSFVNENAKVKYIYVAGADNVYYERLNDED